MTGAPRWYLRLRGDEKEFVTVWLTLRQRTLHHETQFMPGPETNVEATWEYLLKKNAELLGMSFALGPEEAVYLVGRVPVERVDEEELDRIMGASLAYTDECFPTAMSLGYEGRYRRRPPSSARHRPEPTLIANARHGRVRGGDRPAGSVSPAWHRSFWS